MGLKHKKTSGVPDGSDATKVQPTSDWNSDHWVAGTLIGGGNFSLSGWGSGFTLDTLRGYTSAHSFRIVAGTSPSTSPTVTFTFPEGAFGTAPIVIANMVAGTGQFSDIAISQVGSTTKYVLTYRGTPVAGLTYQFNVLIAEIKP